MKTSFMLPLSVIAIACCLSNAAMAQAQSVQAVESVETVETESNGQAEPNVKPLPKSESDVRPAEKLEPKKGAVKPYPNTPVWNSVDRAAKEFPGFEFIGEYVNGQRGLQVTAAEGRFYVSEYQGGLPGAGWDNGDVMHRWLDRLEIKSHLAGWERVDRSKQVTGKQPPPDAVVLFDGTNTDAWHNGEMEGQSLKAGTRTKKKYRDFRLYLEFLIPLKPEPPISHPHRGNSGVLAVGAYEIQITDTFGLDYSPQAWQQTPMLKPVNTWCGSVYGVRSADVNMCLPPLAWQSMEVDFKAARFEDGKKVSAAVISVIQNGVQIHNEVTLPRGTGGGPSGPRREVGEGHIVLQSHGNPNLFRNIWVVPGE